MHRLLAVCAACVVLTPASFAQDRAPRHPKFPRWITDYTTARGLARANDKPLMVVLRCEP